ncbi:hypothetical protein ACFLZ7_01190 [Nanoarchaeota archaeon]
MKSTNKKIGILTVFLILLFVLPVTFSEEDNKVQLDTSDIEVFKVRRDLTNVLDAIDEDLERIGRTAPASISLQSWQSDLNFESFDTKQELEDFKSVVQRMQDAYTKTEFGVQTRPIVTTTGSMDTYKELVDNEEIGYSAFSNIDITLEVNADADSTVSDINRYDGIKLADAVENDYYYDLEFLDEDGDPVGILDESMLKEALTEYIEVEGSEDEPVTIPLKAETEEEEEIVAYTGTGGEPAPNEYPGGTDYTGDQCYIFGA